MNKCNKTQELFQKKIDTNYETYISQLEGMKSFELIDKAEEIAATKKVYMELKDGGYNADYLEYLLHFQNPLEVVRDQWLNEQENVIEEAMKHILWTLADKRDAEQDYALDEAFCEPEQDEGVQIC